MSVFNSSNLEENGTSKKEDTSFEDNFNDPFEILVNPTNSTESTALNDESLNNENLTKKTSITTQDLFSDNFLNEQFTPFESINNPFSSPALINHQRMKHNQIHSIHHQLIQKIKLKQVKSNQIYQLDRLDQ